MVVNTPSVRPKISCFFHDFSLSYRNQPKIPHGTGIVTYIYHKFKAIHVAKHTSPMEYMGT